MFSGKKWINSDLGCRDGFDQVFCDGFDGEFRDGFDGGVNEGFDREKFSLLVGDVGE